MSARYGDKTRSGDAVSGSGRRVEGGLQAITATGGTVATPGDGYKYHTFSTPGTFTVTAGSGDVGVIWVAGGGGSPTTPLPSVPAPTGTARSGGSGGGGVRTGSEPVSPSPGSYPITVGAGGASGSNGNPTSAFGITVTGGGRGGTWPNGDGQTGGSGGGAGGPTFDVIDIGEASASSTGQFGNRASPLGRGGGAADSGGQPSPTALRAGNGATIWGTTYGGGGAASPASIPTPIVGGSGGGGNAGSPGTDGLGGGGGGGSTSVASPLLPAGLVTPGGAGGDGVVVIRYWVGT